MSNFTVIPGSQLPITTTQKADDFVFYLTDLGGGLYRLDRMKRSDFLTIVHDDNGLKFDTSLTPSGILAMFNVDGTNVLFFDEPNDLFRTNKKFEVSNGIGVACSLSPDGTITVEGSSPLTEANIAGNNVSGSGDFELPRRSNVFDPVLVGLGSSIQEIVTSTGSSEEIFHKGTINFVELNPGAAVTSLDLEITDPNNMDKGSVIHIHNISGNNITGITYTLNGGVNGSLPATINAGEIKSIYLGGGNTWYLLNQI